MTSFSVRSRPALFTAFLLLVAMPILVAQAAEPETILIKNVHLIDRVAVAEDALVNILITDGKLNVVTEDDIAPATFGKHFTTVGLQKTKRRKMLQ